jgi:hypothetical protein
MKIFLRDPKTESLSTLGSLTIQHCQKDLKIENLMTQETHMIHQGLRMMTISSHTIQESLTILPSQKVLRTESLTIQEFENLSIQQDR